MNPLSHFALKLQSQATRSWYVQRERRWARRKSSDRALEIVFSRRPGWEPALRTGFAGLGHRLSFASLRHADLERFDLIVPLSLEDARLVRQQPTHVRARMLPLPDEACTALCHDKPRLNQHLAASGFADHIPAMGDDLRPPYIFKPDCGENSQGCMLVADAAAEERMAGLAASGLGFRQSAVPGRIEYATHFLMRDGELVRELTVRYHHDAPLYIKGTPGAEVLARTLGSCPDLRTLRGMAAAIGYDGLGCANYKMERGVLRLIEINPRMGGSLCDYFFSFLRSMPGIQRSREHGCTNWTWLDSRMESQSAGLA